MPKEQRVTLVGNMLDAAWMMGEDISDEEVVLEVR
jgi:hypothetical protein